MKQLLSSYIRNEEGQTSTEYILLLAVAAAIVFKFKDSVMGLLFGDGGQGGILGRILDPSRFDDLVQ